MSDLTIDNILNEIRSSEGDVKTQTEKTASADKTSFTENEIDQMTEFLKQADIEQLSENQEIDMDKVAEMSLLLSAAFDTVEDADKFDSFRKEAMSRGYEKEAIDKLIEKKASVSFLKNLNKKQLMMGMGGMGLLSASGAGGYHLGTEKQKEKTKEVAQGAFRAGRMYQHERHQGKLNMIRQRIAERLRSMNQGQ